MNGAKEQTVDILMILNKPKKVRRKINGLVDISTFPQHFPLSFHIDPPVVAGL